MLRTVLLRSFIQDPEGSISIVIPTVFHTTTGKNNDKNQIKLVNYILLHKPHIAIS